MERAQENGYDTLMVTVDTATYWTPFGQFVILCLIQAGGLGVMTLATLLALVVRGRLRTRQRLAAQAETHALDPGEVRGVVKRVVGTSLLIEGVVAVALTVRFRIAYDDSVATSVWHGVFHAVSAFNNAGFGLDLDFARNDIADEERHLDLHVRATMRLTHAALGAMLERGRGRILNVASVAAFLPRGTYGAVKMWIVSFSRWANAEYAARGVTTTAVCPGFTHTNFHERMGLAPGKEGIPGPMWLDARDVVAEALTDAARGKPISIPSTRYKVLVAVARLLPNGLAARLAKTGR